MTSTELTVIGCGVLLGYWIVSALFNRKSMSSENFKSKADAKKGTLHGESQHGKPHDENPGGDRGDAASWFRVLDVSEDAAEQEITAAYKKIIRQYHPDKVAQMGAEIRELAESKSKQINAAYDYAMRLRR